MRKFFLLGFVFVLSMSASFAQSKWTAGSQRHFQSVAPGTSIRILVKVNEVIAQKSFANQAISIHSQMGNIWSISATKEQVLWMLDAPEVLSLEMSFMSQPKQILDSASRHASAVHLVQEQPFGAGIATPFTGKDVVIGIVDIGFQADHPTFYDSTGQQNRVVRYWDQLDNAGNPPLGFDYGSLHTTLGDMVAKPITDETHGTHVAGIAGGSGYGSENLKYVGMAPESDLIFVNIKYYDDSLPPSAKGDLWVASPAIIDGLNYIFQYADSVNKPAVVNLSWGMHSGPHDGTSLFDLAIENLTGPGKIFVGAAGNSGWTRTHIGKLVQKDTMRTMPFNNRNVKADIEDMYIDMWGSAETDFNVSLGLADTNGFLHGSTVFFSTEKDTIIQGLLTVPGDLGGTDSLEYLLSIVSRYSANKKPNILFEIKNYTPQTRRTTLFVYSDSSHVHAWNSGQIYEWGEGGFAPSFWGHSALPGYTSGDNKFIVGENGGTGKQTITVAAYNSSVNGLTIDGDPYYGGWGNLAPFSSQGPTVDGRIKPDIAAPGENVISGYNRHAYNGFMRYSITDTVVSNGVTNYWGIASGTSMASPNAAGVIALFLQENATLSPDIILDVLTHTATVDDETGAVPNTAWGRGKINAYEGLRYIQTSVGMDELEDQEWKVYPNPSNGKIQIWGVSVNAKYAVYDLSGRAVASGKFDQFDTQLHLDSGLYLLRVEEGEKSQTFRIQILP